MGLRARRSLAMAMVGSAVVAGCSSGGAKIAVGPPSSPASGRSASTQVGDAAASPAATAVPPTPTRASEPPPPRSRQQTCFDLEHALECAEGVERSRSVTELQSAFDGLRDFSDAIVEVTPDPALETVARRLSRVMIELEAAGQAPATPDEFTIRVRRSPTLQRDLLTYRPGLAGPGAADRCYRRDRLHHCAPSSE